MKRILIIDDAEFARVVLKNMLQQKGYEVCSEAEDGFKGIELYKQLKPDLVICDIRMHGMSGEECITQILSEDSDARVLVCAAIESEEKLDKVQRLGVKGVIKKPVYIEELSELVEKALNEEPEEKSYKDIMEERALAEGIKIKFILDYFAAFKSINGVSLDDSTVDESFLLLRGEEMIIGMRAVLSAKIPFVQLNKLEQIFRELVIYNLR